MSDVVIRAEGLGKKYLIGHQAERERYTALRDVAARTARGLVRSVKDMARGRQMIQGDEVEEFWALKDVNFEIKRGDVVGIIGRNGAGKSTLLKILSRITEPSTGRVEIRGRVASLLEVGTGFHPELTGRENIYLNGAILGMTREEIRRKFDEIVAFAEVEKFLDTPVKRYSSGMYVRLAFAVAAHLEPEILVVDEVLAVGDSEFQKKCLGKMGEVAGHGRTVLFVSHNNAAIRALCPLSMLLQSGSASSFGKTEHVIEAHTSSLKRPTPQKPTPENVNAVDAEVDHAATSSENLRLNLKIKIAAPGEFEFRAFFKGPFYESLGMLSLGGFGSRGFILERGCYLLSMDADISQFAQGGYFIEVDILDHSNQKATKAVSIISFHHNNIPLLGESNKLSVEWGVGFVRIPARLYALDRKVD